MKCLVMDEIQIGQKVSKTFEITEGMVFCFCGLTGDMNPIHTNEDYAKKTKFQKRIVPGLLPVCLMASSLLGCELPGASSVYVSQEVRFRAPVFIGDILTAEVEVVAKDIEKNRITVKTTCRNQNGQLVVDGLGVTMPAKEKTL